MALCEVCQSTRVHLMESTDFGDSFADRYDPIQAQYLKCGDCGNSNEGLFEVCDDSRFQTHADVFLQHSVIRFGGLV